MADDAIFQDAIENLRTGNKAKARDLLTGLLKTEQNNVMYWIWLSAAMETPKERVYCLQTALKLDPENATAKRGLILLGALPADETIRPFPVNRPRAWEEKLLLAHEKPKPKGWAAVKQSPVFRLGIVILLIGGLASAAIFGFIIPRANRAQVVRTTPTGPSPTYTTTPTSSGAKPHTPVAGTPDSLSAQFNVDYTPTALYVGYDRSPQTSDYWLQFENAFKKSDWDAAITALENIVALEPKAEAYYYMGEAYRFKNDPGRATQAYDQARQTKPDFGPAYLGLARAQLMTNPNANVLPLLDEAIKLDPNFGEAYLERAKIKIRDNDLSGALNDLGKANSLMLGSPQVYYYLAVAQFRSGDLERALGAAKQAKQLDETFLPTYLLLGQIYAELKDYAAAIEAFQIYLKHEAEDVSAMVQLGKIYFVSGDYEQTIATMNQVIVLERTRQEAYLYRFYANIELGNGPAADEDLDAIIDFYPEAFDANLAVIRAHFINERYGSAEQALEKTEELAETDEQKALIYYWSALVYAKREKAAQAAEYWALLLELPEDAMTAEMRAEAEEQQSDNNTPTPTPRPANTNRPGTPSPTVTKSPTPTPTPTK